MLIETQQNYLLKRRESGILLLLKTLAPPIRTRPTDATRSFLSHRLNKLATFVVLL